MAAFLSAIGGAGQAAGEYGHQARQHLESRRHDLAAMIGQAAESETDPQTRINMLQHQTDLLGGKPLGKIVADFAKTTQKRHQDEQHFQGGVQGLSSMIGGAPEQPKPQPGPAPPGQTPGTPSLTAGAAAQPASNPLQGGAPPELTPPPQAAAPVLTPAPGTGPQDPQAIMNRFLSDPRYAAPANRHAMDAAAQSEISHNEALRQEIEKRNFEMGAKKEALGKIKSTEQWKALPDFLKSQYEAWSVTPGGQMPQTGASMMRPMNTPGVIPSGSINPESLLNRDGDPIDPTANPFVREHQNIATGERWYTAAPTPTQTVMVNGQMTNVAKVPGAMEGASPISMMAPVNTGVDAQGHRVFQSKGELLETGTGKGTDVAFIPTNKSSSVSTPGQPTVTTSSTTRKGSGGGVAAGYGGVTAVPAASPASPASGQRAPLQPVDDPIAKRNYEDWVNGRGVAPTGKDLTGVKMYAVAHGLPSPDTLTASAQKELADIDPIIDEVRRLRKMMDERAKQKTFTKAYLGAEYAKYNYLKKDTPEADLISGLSFADLRSAAQALRGSGSKAAPILYKALEHTPHVGINFDEPALIARKLGEMEKRLVEGRSAIIKNDTKSGIVRPESGGDMVKVRLSDGRTGSVHASRKDEFLKNNPGSSVVP